MPAVARSPGPVAIDDALDAETLAAATKEAAVQLARAFANNPARTIKSMVRQEVENVASGAVGAWIKKRAEQRQRETVSGSFEDWLLQNGVPVRRV